ncbi:PREDICTED: alpha-1,3-mannosyl-glycoprotein 4-beta-N-acetylglucosaminyltransferase C-like [Chinchilla lanigera]|uniref:Alpha-1,3-mannosyl-glycoprotein 4-beta-N-acetylglucosaminyltransferase C-like n=1 Tax=Chinchilla lanigera TaxID=34839 RepID=A0A8C2VSS7_CHILA|nr:PREDICTED: alpha-1,3-mannosyl-glycoprotein 4-beta-N-acetylglucosaminyltransferase C-like [Chinchilla lanigera]XP_013377934.1 PREDICTED: alpha-1,3-mannosyl-glycoprotein 4-beta-N-acetylglucosaminyltransferase C-like [Chinchilla lanigera]XP_013377938.1 PREDICTED: alpha-1,3-mannosyl-glycoprotein 4-beta-N-acetylglucosaminyltransferase C-like [Chinchilla lanigera]XP_013377942.1 PREDICTED: alpha-1,3-mannosyl-glycoprotein 4-beta-N-acetylglucosaminyltransferase C-like [Chinchilla lanigera]
MQIFPWGLVIAAAVVLPAFYFITENPFDSTSFLSLEEKKMVAWQRARMQINPGITEHLRNFKDMQRNSEPLKNVNTQILIGVPPVEKKLLTIGISSVQHPQGSYVLDTLQSLFFASSSPEQKLFVVLIHLASPSSTWLGQMTSNISTLFKSYIQARQLLVINTPQKSYLPLKKLPGPFSDSPAFVAFYSKQNMDYAFLMNFAANYSDYFLMIEDDVKCLPGFVTQIVSILSAWERRLWVTLEFCPLGFIGKLFHTRDLPYFVHFLLLFYQEMPCDYLLSHFLNLLKQNPIQFSPSLFQHVDKFNSFKEVEENIGYPSNPAATLYTNLNVTDNSNLMSAYSLDNSYFYIEEAKAGSYLTVFLHIPAIVFHVQVLTGSELKEENQLEEGQVELGYDSTNRVTDCDDYVLLGMLINGTLNKHVLSEDSGKKVKCVRLFVTATVSSGLIVRHINLWVR